MAVNSSPARRVFTKAEDGNWIDRTLPFLEGFRTAPFGQQRAVIQELAALTGQAENTARRALVALQYLDDKGVDLANLHVRPPVMSIEAVLRVGKRQAGLEDDLLQKLLRGEGTAAEFREAADRLLADLAVHKGGVSRVRKLSDIVIDHITPSSFVVPKFRQPLGPRPRPYVVVDIDKFRLVIFRVTGKEPALAKAIGYRLLEASVLQAVVTGSRTIVCSDIPLDDLEAIRGDMGEWQDRLLIERCSLEDDIAVILGNGPRRWRWPFPPSEIGRAGTRPAKEQQPVVNQ
ncbi:hypothetical protein IED13_27230 [Bosea sp. SSUT16]|uniref:Uncharacterized protein n=1 Tax=Bosea spartocytisi TaxID=2773451 RepID=A0A927EGB0_9HYPH|nr:hypothetical protein [Bosea spartocytisi]MBD3849409.1 hypothetical protein [Bosea spartocytisi]MCT4475001.1 hypothetical protein [Bosea spartocytisi]